MCTLKNVYFKIGEQVSYYVFPPKQNPTKGHKGIFGGDEHVSTLVTLMLSQVQSQTQRCIHWMDAILCIPDTPQRSK